MSSERRWLVLVVGVLCLIVLAFAVGTRRRGEPAVERTESVTTAPAPLEARTALAADARAAVSPAAVVEPAPTIGGLTVRTIDPAGAALPGVRVEWRSKDGLPRDLGVSDPTGRLRVPAFARAAGLLTGSCADRESVSVRIDPTRRSDELTLVLGSEGSLRGRVVLPNGEDAGAGVRIALWRTSLRAPQLDPPAALERLPGGQTVLTDAAGTFSIRGLRAGALYDLIAAGRGCATPTRLESVPADGRELRIEVQALFGVVARFVDARTGEPIVLPESLLPGVTNTLTVLVPGAKLLDARQTLALAGLPLDVLDAWPGVRDCFVTLPPEAEAAGDARILLDCDLPGYVATSAELLLLPVVQDVPEQKVPLRPDSSARGAFEVVVVGLPAARELSHTRSQPEFELVLSSERGSPVKLQFGRVPTEPTLVEGLPAGLYRVQANARIALSDCLWVRDASFEVGRAEAPRARLVVDFSKLGGVVIELQQVDGTPYAGPAVIDLRKPTRDPNAREFCRVQLGTGPFEIFGLAPGSYEVIVHSPAVAELGIATVDVAAGKWREVAFLVDGTR
ncbi:MAG: carboxypeptidase regulatory-like domain-containing protein [Planctomycetes bacterium]|nr:carboxypeptidase regulatory-like domain-containing protein [Planctomycetota bacterium]